MTEWLETAAENVEIAWLEGIGWRARTAEYTRMLATGYYSVLMIEARA